jgi:acyl carrier protein
MNISERVFAIIAEFTGSDVLELTGDTKFVDLGSDSLELAEICIAVEDTFEFQMYRNQPDTIETIYDLIHCVEDYVNDVV